MGSDHADEIGLAASDDPSRLLQRTDCAGDDDRHISAHHLAGDRAVRRHVARESARARCNEIMERVVVAGAQREVVEEPRGVQDAKRGLSLRWSDPCPVEEVVEVELRPDYEPTAA
jgi:hypothetical protein